jgi:prepilin-type N-terminal cleavage/methylation domain-containing protein
MKKLSLKFFLTCNRNRKTEQRCQATNSYISRYTLSNAGFSLIELIAVILMVGILAAIAAPSWLGFVSRQRVNKANDVVLAALQEAQREAKNKKLSYSVSFKVDSGVPKIAVHPDSIAASSLPTGYWKRLGEDLAIQSGQVILNTNLSNTAKNTVGSPPYSFPATITFDYMGTLPNANFGTIPTGSTEPPGLKVVVAVPQGNPPQPTRTKRCVIIRTIIGGMRTEKDGNCN